jgi:hypothetical protein
MEIGHSYLGIRILTFIYTISIRFIPTLIIGHLHKIFTIGHLKTSKRKKSKRNKITHTKSFTIGHLKTSKRKKKAKGTK